LVILLLSGVRDVIWFATCPSVCVAKVDIVVKIQVRNVTLNYSYLYRSLDEWKEVVCILKDTRVLVCCLLNFGFVPWVSCFSCVAVVSKIVSRLTRPI
jgi:hypothetical protein